MHNYGIAHRDLKPSNLLVVSFSLNPDEVRAKLSDFGTADEIDEIKVYPKSGTPPFMAPEVYWSKEYGMKCDSYSYGMTSWSIDAEALPFDGKTKIHNTYQVNDRPPLNPKCRINKLITACWEEVNIHARNASTFSLVACTVVTFLLTLFFQRNQAIVPILKRF